MRLISILILIITVRVNFDPWLVLAMLKNMRAMFVMWHFILGSTSDPNGIWNTIMNQCGLKISLCFNYLYDKLDDFCCGGCCPYIPAITEEIENDGKTTFGEASFPWVTKTNIHNTCLVTTRSFQANRKKIINVLSSLKRSQIQYWPYYISNINETFSLKKHLFQTHHIIL